VRRLFRLLGFACWSLLSVGTVIAIIDWFARWDWFNLFMLNHSRIAVFIHTPFTYLVLLVLGFLFLKADRELNQPKIVAKFVNARMFPDLSTTPTSVLFDTEMKTPGWDEVKIDWEWFIEVQLVNDSDAPTTIENVEVRTTVGSKWRKESVPSTHTEDFDRFSIDMGLDVHGNPNNRQYPKPRHRPVPSLMQEIRGVPLTKGIGHRGWLRFNLPQVSQRDANSGRVKINIWLIDALEGKHKLYYKPQSDKEWDNTFFMYRE
jgi:hypothetical protein